MEIRMSDEYTTTDIINFALDEDPLKLQDAVSQVMAVKVAEFLDAKKVEVAKAFFNPEDYDG